MSQKTIKIWDEKNVERMNHNFSELYAFVEKLREGLLDVHHRVKEIDEAIKKAP